MGLLGLHGISNYCMRMRIATIKARSYLSIHRTHVISNTKEMLAHTTTSASIRFQTSRKYDPGCAITPRSITYVTLRNVPPKSKISLMILLPLRTLSVGGEVRE